MENARRPQINSLRALQGEGELLLYIHISINNSEDRPSYLTMNRPSSDFFFINKYARKIAVTYYYYRAMYTYFEVRIKVSAVLPINYTDSKVTDDISTACSTWSPTPSATRRRVILPRTQVRLCDGATGQKNAARQEGRRWARKEQRRHRAGGGEGEQKRLSGRWAAVERLR